MDDEKYAYWILNVYDSDKGNNKGHFLFNCSACGHEIIDKHPNVCSECSAKMVDPLGRTDVNGRDICAGDIVLCNIDGHNEKVAGKIIHDVQWHFDYQGGSRFIYDCENFQIVTSVIPEGKNLCRDYEKTSGMGKI